MEEDRGFESPLRNCDPLVRRWSDLGHQSPAGEQRYQQVSGGHLKGCLYLADRIQPGLPLVLTEGVFDALTAWQIG